jgi:hypothetical protein
MSTCDYEISLQLNSWRKGRYEGLWRVGFWSKESVIFILRKSDFGLRKVRGPEKHEKRAVMAARVLGKFC